MSTTKESIKSPPISNLDILACPKCKNKLVQIEKCDTCDLKFETDEGTPVLLAQDATRVVQFNFTSTQSYISDDTLESILKDPPLETPNEELPYHLDLAHLHVINRLKKGGRVLEIGCGGGQNRQFFTEMGFDYVGIDISKSRVFDWLREFGGPDYLCDAHFLPFLDQQFDLVYCAAVFEHIASPFLVTQEVYRVLKPGGYFLGNVAFLEPWHDNSYFHMTPLGVIEILKQAEFQIEYVWPGRGYSGFYAILEMCSRFTKKITWIGKGLYMLYRAEHKVKEKLRTKNNPKFFDICNRAKVAGATDWIAYRSID